MAKLVFFILFLSLSHGDDDFFNYLEPSDDPDQDLDQDAEIETETTTQLSTTVLSTTTRPPLLTFFLNRTTSGSPVKRNQPTETTILHEKKSGK